VLGGLISDTVTETEDRVPGLGAIPLIGNLFKSRSSSRQKKNLLVFIRPKIMRNADDTEGVSEASYNDVRRSQQNLNHGKIMLLPGQKQPAVPPIPSGIALPAAPPASDTNAQGALPLTLPSQPPPTQSVQPAPTTQ
jgi:general secretion pathway protein D